MKLTCPHCKTTVAATDGPFGPDETLTCPSCGNRISRRGAGDDSPAAGIRRRGPLSTLTWAVACLLLIAALAGQYAYIMRDELARHVVLRPALEWLCAQANCEIPLMRSPEQVRIAGRDIRRHPEIDDALSVSITLANQAPYRQAYPVIELRFFDIRNRPLALRRFTPEEYLPENIGMADGMPIDTPVRGKLEIVDPGPKAVNFSFEVI